MKKLKSFGSLVVLSWCILLAPMALVGCKTANQSAFKTVKTVDITADVAMKAWAEYVRLKHPGVEVERRVESAYNKYIATMLVVADAGAALAKADNQDTRTKMDIALAAAAAALGDVTSLVQLFGAKIN